MLFINLLRLILASVLAYQDFKAYTVNLILLFTLLVVNLLFLLENIESYVLVLTNIIVVTVLFFGLKISSKISGKKLAMGQGDWFMLFILATAFYNTKLFITSILLACILGILFNVTRCIISSNKLEKRIPLVSFFSISWLTISLWKYLEIGFWSLILR